MTKRVNDPEPHAPADGPLARLVEDQGREEHAAPAPSLPQPPETGHGRDDYAAGTPEHDDDREI